MDRLLNVVTVFSLALIALVLTSVRREHIRVEYSVSWLTAGFFLLVFSRWRTLQDWMTDALGLRDASVALLVVTGAVFLVVLYRISRMISHLKDSNIALTQRLAILEFELTNLHEKDQAPGRS